MTMHRWKLKETAPKDGTHILAACGPYDEHWGFAQRPPAVVHYWSNPGEDGFYLSTGGSLNELPFDFTHWCDLGSPPGIEEPVDVTEHMLRGQEG